MFWTPFRCWGFQGFFGAGFRVEETITAWHGMCGGTAQEVGLDSWVKNVFKSVNQVS